MGMTLKELLTKGEGTLSAQEAKALAAQCRMDVDTLYTLLEERGIKVLEEENEPSLDVDSIIAEVENAENNNDDMGLADENEEDAEENPADLKAAMDELLDDPVKNYLKQIGQIPLLSAEQEVELSRRIHAGAEAAHILLRAQQRDLADLLEVVLNGVVQQFVHGSLQVCRVLLALLFLVLADAHIIVVVLGILDLGHDAVHIQRRLCILFQNLDTAFFQKGVERFLIHSALCSQRLGLLGRNGAFAFRQQFL